MLAMAVIYIWGKTLTQITIGDDVWIGAGAIVLPGTLLVAEQQ